MNKTASSNGFKVAISRDSFLSACHLFLRTVRSKKAQSEEVTFYFDKADFRISWGDATVGVSAEGSWPQKSTIPGRDFLAIAKFPPSGSPLSFEIRDKRFICGTWSCACYIEEAPDGILQPELITVASAVGMPPPPATGESRKQRSSDSETARKKPPAAEPGTPMTQPIRNILRDLDNIRENLLAFSDDVWLSIDHNDTAAMKSGMAFKEKLNAQLDTFSKLSVEMTCLIREYTNIQTEGEASPETEVGATPADNTRIIKDLNRSEPHALTEDFTWKRPCGFILEGRGYKDVSTWTRVYELTLRHLAGKDAGLFAKLPDNPATITRRDNRRFSRSPTDLRKPLALPNGIHAETNLSAKDLCESIRTVLSIFSIPPASCVIFLRQDRDA